MDKWQIMQTAVELCTGATVADLAPDQLTAAMIYTIDATMPWWTFINWFSQNDPDKITASECVLEVLSWPMFGV